MILSPSDWVCLSLSLPPWLTALLAHGGFPGNILPGVIRTCLIHPWTLLAGSPGQGCQDWGSGHQEWEDMHQLATPTKDKDLMTGGECKERVKDGFQAKFSLGMPKFSKGCLL